MKTVTPIITFDGNAGEAFEFYKSVFGGEFSSMLRYRDMQMTANLPEEELDRIAHVGLPLASDYMIMGGDSLNSFGKPLKMGNNVGITLEPSDAQEADRLFKALSDGGEIEMPLEQTEWAEKFGQCIDRFGIQWVINYTGNVQFEND